jgi:O-antigen ligase
LIAVTSVVLTRSNSRIVAPTARLEDAVAGLYGFLVVVLVAGSSGGYFSTTWGWTALVTLWLAAIVLLVRERVEFRALDLMYAGGLTGFGGWVALSNFWTPSVPSTMHEVQRNLAYIGVVAAGLVLVRASTTRQLLGGVLLAIVLLDIYALGIRLVPDRFGHFDSVSYDYRLAPPITYWNGLGIFTVMGIILALGFATRGKNLATRAAAAATVPILATTLYFTFSRGAWYALVAGLIVTVVFDPRRLQLLAVALSLAPFVALSIASAKSREGLTTIGASLRQATTDGHSLLPVLAVLAAGAALIALVAGLIERSVRIPAFVRYAFATALAVALVGGFAWVWTTHGSPVQLAERGWNAFRGPPSTGVRGNDVSTRLFTFSANGRVEYWSVSWDSFEQHPFLGNGAGTFWQLWVRSTKSTGSTTEGHSLYMEILGELGFVGLALLAVGVVAPLLGLLRSRGDDLAFASGGAYVAWLAHAGVDWDWELIGVSAVGLLCGVALLRSGPAVPLRARTLPVWATVSAAVALAFLSLAAVPALLADHALRTARNALPSRPAKALEHASDARRWAPWSSEPDELRGDAYRSAGNLVASRKAYAKALAEDSSSWTLWTKLADVTSGSDHLQALRRAHALNPDVTVP